MLMVLDGKFGYNTIKYTMVFPYSDWLYFPWHIDINNMYWCCFVSCRTWTLKDICYTLDLPPMDDNIGLDTVSSEEFKFMSNS